MTGKAYLRQEFTALVGMNQSGIRHWIRKGVLPSPKGRGRGARYTEEHVLRARIAKHLQERKASLREIRNEVRSRSIEELRALLASLLPSAASTDPQSASAQGQPPPADRQLPASNPERTSVEDLLTEPALWDVIRVRRGLIIMASVEQGPEVRRLAREMCEAYRHIAASLPAR